MAIAAHFDPSDESDRAPRRTLRLEALGATAAGNPARVLIHNLSASGLLLKCPAPLGEGEQILVDLPHAGMTSATVVWASGDMFGCRFDAPISAAVLSAAQLRSPAGADGLEAPFAPLLMSDEAFGARLHRLRKERGMTLSQVGDALGVSKPTVWAWENGRARPVDARIDLLAQVLGVSGAALRGGGDVSDALSGLVLACRRQIATAVGTGIDNVRIMVEL
jgi:transcriptional regulator with XRE-family HTH domain